MSVSFVLICVHLCSSVAYESLFAVRDVPETGCSQDWPPHYPSQSLEATQ